MKVFSRSYAIPKAAWVFAALILPVACDKADPKEHLQRGVEYFKQGDYEKAKLELKTSSQSDKDTAQTYYYLALLDEKNHQYKAMRENLSKVVEMEPKNTEARLKLGKLLLPFGEPDAAMVHAETILKDNGQNLDALALKASVYIRQKKYDDASAIISAILQKNPKFIDALSLQALIFSEKNDAAQAVAVLENAMAIEPKNVDLHFFKIQLHAKAKDMAAVLADYEKLVGVYPENQDYKITLARIYTQTGKNQQADAVLRGLIAESPEAIKYKLLLLDFLSDTAQGQVAGELQKFEAFHSKEPRRLLDLAKWSISHNRMDESGKLLQKIVEEDDDKTVSLAAKTLLAKMAFDNKNLPSAEKLIGEILSDNSSYNDAKVLQARILMEKKQHNQAIDLLNKVLLSQPDLEEALMLSAQAFLLTGEQKKATQFFENTLKANPANSKALAYLYAQDVAANKFKVAKDRVLLALRLQPANLELLEKLARISLLENDLKTAKESVQKIADIASPLAGDLANFLQAKIFQAEGAWEQALKLYKTILAKFPGNKDTLDNMAYCFDKLNRRAEMLALLTELRAKNTSNVAINLMLAELLLQDKKLADGINVLSELLKINDKVPQAYAILAKLRLAQNDKNAARAAYLDGLKQNPDDNRLSLSLATFYEQQGEVGQAVAQYEAMLAKNPNNDAVANNLAVLLMEHNSTDEMLKKAAQLSERFKDSEQPYYKDTYAWALIKQGKFNEGIALLQDVITRSPEVPVFRYHLGVAYSKNDNNGSAIAELQQALDLSANKAAFPEEKQARALLAAIVAKTQGH